MKEIKCWKYGKWSYKFKECRWCGTSKKSWNTRHKGKGLCIKCFDQNRKDKNPKRREQLKNQGRKWYLSKGITPEKKHEAYLRVIKWQHTPQYKKRLKTYIYERRRFIYFVRSLKRKNLKKFDNCLEIIINGQRVKTPIQPPKAVESDNDKTINKIELFKEIYLKYKA